MHYGQEISFKAGFQKPEVARNEGGFDYSQYLKTKKIVGTVFCQESKITVLKEKNVFLGSKLQAIKNRIHQQLNKLFSEKEARLCRSTYHRAKTRTNRRN